MAIASEQIQPADPPAAPERPGFTGMWVGISLEFFEFTVFFAVYFAARLRNPQAFRDGAQRLWGTAGLLITLVMVTSGYFLTRSIHAVRQGRQAAARVWICAALATAVGYPVMKLLEIGWNHAHGLGARADIFVTVYYYLTINHLVHASWGILGMCWVTVRMFLNAYEPEDLRGLESLAIYWHATDIVWLMLFSFFYAFVR
ncbi:MAG: cytochrome c oxidase subunit 3 [Burkholderiales bacterium]|nr:cytochrome c oxidase subunit 3 [Burkholderiales bacterium]